MDKCIVIYVNFSAAVQNYCQDFIVLLIYLVRVEDGRIWKAHQLGLDGKSYKLSRKSKNAPFGSLYEKLWILEDYCMFWRQIGILGYGILGCARECSASLICF